MPAITSCPSCEKKLKVPDDLLGKKVKCPGCTTMFTAKEDGAAPAGGKTAVSSTPAPPSSRRRDDEDDRNRDRDRDRGRDRDRDRDSDRDRDRRDGRDRGRDRRDDDYERDRDRDRDRRDDRDRDRGRDRRDDDYERDRDRDRDRGRDRRDDDDDYDRDRGRGRYRDDYDRPRADPKKQYLGTAFGLQLCIYGGWTMIGALGGFIAFALLSYLLAMGGAFGVLLWLGFVTYAIVGLAVFAGSVLWMVGMGMCLQAPSERGHPTWALALSAFICTLVPIALGSIFVASAGMGLVMVNGGINGFVSLAAMILWCMFLKNLCDQVRQGPTGSKCITWMIAALITGAVCFILFIIAVTAMGVGLSSMMRGGGRAGAQFGGILTMVISIFSLAAFVAISIWHIMILGEVKTVCETTARKLGRS